MSMAKRAGVLVVACILSYLSHAAPISGVIYNQVFDPRIQTVLLYPIGFPTKMPLLLLNGPGNLIFSFDLLGDERTYYNYTIQQCDHRWMPTDLSVYDYVNGFSASTINNYNYSNNTRQPYIHYTLDFPNFDMNITKSGNYAIIVYEDDPSEPAITWRFLVAEPKVEIEAGVVLPRNISDRDKFQEILFNVYHEGIEISNPWMETNAVVLQDDRWDNAVTDLKPLFVRENELEYNHNMKCVFETSRDFRRLDMRSFRYIGDGMSAINESNSGWDIYLSKDLIRKNEQKSFYQQDINGKFFIDVYELKNPDTEGDYAYVHFSLPFAAPLETGAIYIVGTFNNYMVSEVNKLTYNFTDKAYQGMLFMKQGFYDYAYLYADEDPPIRDHSLTEGDYYDTEHDYTILFYHRSFGQRYDRLIGIKNINSDLNKF